MGSSFKVTPLEGARPKFKPWSDHLKAYTCLFRPIHEKILTNHCKGQLAHETEYNKFELFGFSVL